MNIAPFLKSILWRRRRWGLALAALLLLYTLAGFLILPMVLKSVIPRQAGQLLGRTVTLERVRTNPFTLSITLDGLQVHDLDGSPLLTWRRLYVNAELWSLLWKRLSFKVIDLQQPRIRMVLQQGGRLNISDILKRFSTGSTAPSNEPMRLSIGRLRVLNAELAFVDRSLMEPFSSTLGPFSIDLERFTTERDARSPYAFNGRTEAGESFAWSGTLGTEPLRSSGVFELNAVRLPKYTPYYQHQVGFDLREGTGSAKAAYEFEWSGSRHVMRLFDGSMNLDNLTLAEKGQREPAILLPSAQIRGIDWDLLKASLKTTSVTLDGLEVLARHEPPGRLNLQAMFTSSKETQTTEPSTFKMDMGELALKNASFRYEDTVPARPAVFNVHHLDASLKGFNLEPDHAALLNLSMRLGETASFAAKGNLALLRPSGDLDLKLEGLDLPGLDAYLDSFSDIRLSRGKAGLSGHLAYDYSGKKDDGMSFRGDIRVTDMEARDRFQDEPFLGWKHLRLAGAVLRSQRPSVTIQTVEWIEPEGRLVMARDGISNIARALRMTSTGPVASAVPPSPPQDNPLVLRIANMRVASGRLSFIDRSLEPNAVLMINEMDGLYTGLSTESEQATQVDFKGKAGGLALITIQGKAMPLRHDKDTDVALKIVGANLTDFSPYTGKYLGYTTRQGKLDVDARIRIQDRKLNIEDKVRLDRMYLGDKVDSPDATHLPVKLGLALLRDRKGVIELEVPVDGSLDDPDIHYGKLVWKAVFNVLGKIVTSPFTLISNLFGGGRQEDLGFIAFPPGSSAVEPSEEKKLETLIKALTERPELRLELEGTTDSADAMVFRHRDLETQLQLLKWNARNVKTATKPSEEIIEPSEREFWLREAFKSAFPPPKDTQAEAPPLAEVEQRLLQAIPIDPNDLRQLADARNKAAIEHLLQGDQIGSDRIFEVQGSDTAKAGGSKVHFTLR